MRNLFCRLLYLNFEWEMHLGMDHKEQKMNFYRDHFVHQIRNAYCMHMLLEKFGWLEKVKKVLLDDANNKLCKYVQHYLLMQLKSEHTTEGYRTKQYFIDNMIYMASYICALFHDSAYPEVANYRYGESIREYLPSLYSSETSGFDFDRLVAFLQNSLLFQTVSRNEIKKRIQGEDIDHGALSAIILLMSFYENGAIQDLEPYKRCAVELAGLAIYNHTNKYRYESREYTKPYVRELFSRNPISYLLRISDDLQEWDRIYFEVSNVPNMVICTNCGTPIIRKRISGGVSEQYSYICNCSHRSSFEDVFDSGNFPYRRIYNVTVCDEVFIREEDNSEIIFELDYDLEKLLQIAYINPRYAYYRIKELNAFKHFLDYQESLPIMWLKYCLSPNIIFIKVEIIYRWFASFDLEIWPVSTAIQSLCQKDVIVDKMRWEEKSASAVNDVKSELMIMIGALYPDTSSEQVKETMEYTLTVYAWLYVFRRAYVEFDSEDERNKLNNYFEDFVNFQCGRCNKEARILIKDCKTQYKRMGETYPNQNNKEDEYYKQYETDEYTYTCVERFIAPKNYTPCFERKEIEIDAYTDLLFIRHLIQVIRRKKAVV